MSRGPDSANRKRKHKVGFGLVFLLVLLLVLLSFIPLIDSNRWWIRLLDFPRLQEAIVLLVLAVPVILYFRYFRKMAGLALILIIIAVSSHAYILMPYAPTGTDFPPECPPGKAISVMVANVKMENEPEGRLIDIVREQQPDLLLAMETNAEWDQALAPLSDTMPYTVSHISDSHFGIHLFSRLELVSPQIRFLAGQGTPQVVTGVTLRSGETIDFIGLHPRPPMPFGANSTVGRDAILYKAGFLMRENEGTGIVAGDFNATPWETAVERMRQIGSLQDPRRGYGYVPTFSAESWWMAWPLDQVFHETGFVTLSLERLPDFGSDHFPFMARFCRVSGGGGGSASKAEAQLIRTAKQVIEKAKQG